jgi:hypothetical protein
MKFDAFGQIVALSLLSLEHHFYYYHYPAYACTGASLQQPILDI